MRSLRTAQALYDTVVARYSSPATAALGRLLLPYLFPELSAFATVEDLVSHLHSSDARYRAAAPAEVVAVGVAHGTPRTPFFEGCSPAPLAPSYASVAAVDVPSAEDVGAASASAKRRSSKGKGGRGGGDGSVGGSGGSSGGGGGSGGGGSGKNGGGSGGFGGGGGGSSGSGGSGSGGSGGSRTGAQHGGSREGQRQRPQRRSETLSPQQLHMREASHSAPLLDDALCAKFGDEVEHPHWAELLRSGVVIFDLDFDAILSAMYAVLVSAEGDCYLCVPPDPCIEAAALGVSESSLPGTAPAEALHTFTLDSGPSRCFFRDSTTLTPLSAPVPVRLAEPSGGPVLARSTTILPCPAVLSGSLSGLHLPSFSTNLVSTAALQDAMVTTTTPGTLLWHRCLGHPSLPCLRGMHSHLLVSGLPRSLPPLPPSPAPPCLPCIEGRQRATPHSSSFPPTTAPLQSLHMDIKGEVPDVLIPWIRGQLGGEFSSDLLRDFCRGEGITQLFSLPTSPQQNGIAEHCIGLVKEVTRTSMIHAAAPYFLWPFAVRYTAHHLNLWHRVSLPKTTPTLRCIGKDATFDESVPFYCLFPYCSAPPSPPPLFLAPGPPPASSGVSEVDPLPGAVPVEGVGPWGEEPGGAESGGAGSRGAEPKGAALRVLAWGRWGRWRLGVWGIGPADVETGGAEPEGVEPGGVESEGAESGGVEPRGAASSGGPAGALPRLSPRPEPLSPQQLREWLVWRARLQSGAARGGATGDTGNTGAGGAGVTTGAGGTGGAAAAGPRGARTRGSGAAGTGGFGDAGGRDPTEPGAARAGGVGAGGTGAGGAGAGGARASGARAGGTGAGGAGAGGAGAVDPRVGGAGAEAAGGTCARGTVRLRPYFVPMLQQVLGVPSSTSLTPPLLCPPPDHSQPPLKPTSPLPAPSPYSEQTGGLTERHELASCPASPICADRRVPRPRPPPVPSTHAMALRPSSVALRVPLHAPPGSSLPAVPDPESDLACAATPTVSRLLATVVTDPAFESTAASTLIAGLLDFVATCRLDYATALVAQSESASPPSVGGECALGTDVLEDRQEDFECLAAVVPRFVSMLLASEGDSDAPDIPAPRSYTEAITGTYVDTIPLSRANIVDGMWIFRVKRPLGSPPAFKARYVARGFNQRQGVDYFQTFSPTLKMTTLRVLLHVAAQRDNELRSLEFSTAFFQGSLHEEIWLLRPPGFTGSFPDGTLWSLRRPVYCLRQAPREWHDTLRTTLAAQGFTPSTADPPLFLCTDTSLPPFYVLVYVDDLVFATADTEALTLVKSELQKRHTCTDLGELRSYLGLQIIRDRARRTITLTQSHMVHQSVEPSGPYPELVGCLMYLMTCTRPDLAYPLSLLARYVAPGRHQKVHWDAAKRVLHYLCSTLGLGLVLGGRGPVVLIRHADASWVDDSATQRSSQGYTFSLGSGSVSWRSTHLSSVLSSSCEAQIYVGAMAAQELRWLTYLLNDLGEQPRSPPVLYVDNKAMIALCQEH
ncbi:unnamed protein product [Closterium sp. NIES-53]